MNTTPNQPRYQYSVGGIKAGFWEDAPDPAKLEATLNEAAANGWRLATTINSGTHGRASRVLLVFERRVG